MVKKNFLGGLKLLLVPLFIMVLGISSTCYARTTLTNEEAEYLWNYFFKDTYNEEVYCNEYNNFTEGEQNEKQIMPIDYVTFQTYFNANNDIEITENTYFFINYWGTNTLNTKKVVFYIYNFNNTIDNTLPYLYLKFTNPELLTIYAIDDDKNYVTHQGRKFNIEYYTPSDIRFSNFTTNSISTSGKTFKVKNTNSLWNKSNSNYTTTLSPLSRYN